MDVQSSSVQVPLLSNQETGHDFDTNKEDYGGDIIEEIKRQLRLAVPLVAVNILQYCLQVISIMFVGHLGELALSGASMATSFASVTGFSVLEWEVHWKHYVGKPTELSNTTCLAFTHKEQC